MKTRNINCIKCGFDYLNELEDLLLKCPQCGFEICPPEEFQKVPKLIDEGLEILKRLGRIDSKNAEENRRGA